jgi:NTP pyrophosphatase (non-canonical NTP hydrolase)
MAKKQITLQGLKKRVAGFVKERDWEQFHSPKNLSMSLSIEAAELMEHFQWTNTVGEAVKILQDKRKRIEIEDELADIAIYLIDFCNLYGVDIERAVLAKLKKNAKKYPAKLVKGKMEKYTFYKRKKSRQT